VNLVAVSEPGTQIFQSSLIVTIGLSRIVSEISARDRQTDNAGHYCSSFPHSDKPATSYEVPEYTV